MAKLTRLVEAVRDCCELPFAAQHDMQFIQRFGQVDAALDAVDTAGGVAALIAEIRRAALEEAAQMIADCGPEDFIYRACEWDKAIDTIEPYLSAAHLASAIRAIAASQPEGGDRG